MWSQEMQTFLLTVLEVLSALFITAVGLMVLYIALLFVIDVASAAICRCTRGRRASPSSAAWRCAAA